MTTLVDPNEYWTIEYRRDGIERKTTVYVSTLMTALALFNGTEATSGFDTPLRMTYGYPINGTRYTFTLDGRYAVPHRV